MLGVQVLFLFELAKSQYCIRLEKKKQILKFHYGIMEWQLLKYVRIARKTKGSTSQVFFTIAWNVPW
jgi:hypothetical protein